MKLKQLYLVALASLFVLSSQASAQITTADAEPETDILLDAITDVIPGGPSVFVSTLINAGFTQGARGDIFQLGAAGDSFTLSGFTLQASAAATFAEGNTFAIALYTGDPGSVFAPMTSPETFENVTPEFLDANSGLTLIYQEDFLGTDATGDAPDGQVDVRNFVTFELSDPVVPGGEAITVFVFTNFAFAQLEGNGNGGGRLQLRDNTTALAESGSRDLRFSISGVAETGIILGDIDGDGDVDFEDIPGFIALITGGGLQAEGDIDGDGDVDFEDIPLFIDIITGA